MKSLGKTHWAGAEGHIPGWSHADSPELESHEALCILNTAEAPAHCRLTLYFTDREPAGPYKLEVGAQRTKHVRLNSLQEPEPVPRATDFAWALEADVPIVVQHTRLDSRQAANALMTAVPFSQD